MPRIFNIADADVIEESPDLSQDGLSVLNVNPLDFENLNISHSSEPIVIRGNGNLTLFGLSNQFNDEFPASLIGRVSREEFEETIGRVNQLLRQSHSTNGKLLLLGCLCCCCSLGCSFLWPSVALNKRTKASLKKLLASENSRLYRKLGFNWRLARQRAYSNHAFVEYVLLIEFVSKVNLYLPE